MKMKNRRETDVLSHSLGEKGDKISRYGLTSETARLVDDSQLSL